MKSPRRSYAPRRIFGAVAVDGRALRHSQPFRRMFFGQFVSLIGRQITIVAVPYQVYQLTHSPALVGLLGLVQVVPLITVSLLGGTLADQHDRRTLLLITQSALLVCSALLAWGALAGQPPLLYLYGVVALSTCFSAIDSPTRTAIVPNIVEREQLSGALALNFGLFQVSMVAGPALGGLVIGHFGLGTAYLIDVGTFLAALIAVYLLPAQRPSGATVGESRLVAIGQGFSFVRHQQAILGGFAVDMMAMIFGLPIALFPALAANTFHVNATGLGLLYAAPGVGGVLAALTAGWISRGQRHGRVVIWSVLVWGVAITGFGVMQSLAPALLFMAIAGAADAYSGVARNTMMQMLTPDHLRGRLTAVYFTVVNGGARLGDLEAGVVGSLTTPQISVVSGGLACLVGLGVAALAFPALWRYRADQSAATTAGS